MNLRTLQLSKKFLLHGLFKKKYCGAVREGGHIKPFNYGFVHCFSCLIERRDGSQFKKNNYAQES